MQEEQSEQTKIRKLLDWIIDRGVNGVGPLQSASQLAEEYLLDQSYKNNDARVQALIKWERSKHFTVGFLTGLGGLLTLPVNVAAELGAQWVLSARMSAAIAIIYGHSTKEDRVRTFILLAIVANQTKDVLRELGILIGRGISKKIIDKVSSKALRDIQRRIGVIIITKAGKKSFTSLTRLIPVVGGTIGGIIDAVACQQTGRMAQRLFRGTQSTSVVVRL